jgi:hypothetical protein
MLIEHIWNRYKTVSIVGMEKNAGKTVTLNALLEEAYGRDKKIGLTSIGRDGESKDLVTATHKPSIFVCQGTYVATAESLFVQAEGKLEILEITDFKTSMGNIVIGKVMMSGNIEIAGPCSNDQLILLIEKMQTFGADLVIVDGAIDRKSTASPSVTSATILATGAVLSRDITKGIEQTVYQGRLFQLKGISDTSIRAIAVEAIRSQRIAILGSEVLYLKAKTALNAGHLIGGQMDEKTTHVIIPGALVKQTVMDMIKSTKHYQHVTLVVKDATRIFIDYKDWMYFEKLGVRVLVCDPINLVAITLNPTSPSGYYYDPKIYQEQLQFYFKDIPVIDVLS